MKKLPRALVATIGLVAASTTLQAQTVSAINGTPYNTTSITDFSTTGADMNGMQVIVCLSSVGCQTRSWGAWWLGHRFHDRLPLSSGRQLSP